MENAPTISDYQCSLEGCIKPKAKTGLCSMHYSRLRRTGTTDEPPKRKTASDHPCEVEECGLPSESVKPYPMCKKHHTRWKRNGDPANAYGGREKWLREAITRDTDECIEWPWKVRSHGYGTIRINGEHRTVHNWALRLSAGPPPEGKHHAAHKPVDCHNKRCVNPRHLRWASPSENIADMQRDGSHVSGFTLYMQRTGLHPYTKKPLKD